MAVRLARQRYKQFELRRWNTCVETIGKLEGRSHSMEFNFYSKQAGKIDQTPKRGSSK